MLDTFVAQRTLWLHSPERGLASQPPSGDGSYIIKDGSYTIYSYWILK